MFTRRAGVLAGALATACLLVAPAWAGSRACGASAYSYAGFQGQRHAASVSATIGVRTAPRVASGHVMAWVGVGGPGEGPRGTDAWLQAGISAFPGAAPSVYYEIQKPDGTYRYIGVLGLLEPGEKHGVAVVETERPGWWRVFVDRKAVSRPIHMPGSHGRWFGDAEAESWNGGRTACNHLDFSFEDVTVDESTSVWTPLFVGRLLQDPGYRVIRGAPNAFVATSA